MYPKLRIQLISDFSRELVRSVMAGDLNLALVTAPPENSRITAAAFGQTRLYAALPKTHTVAQKEDIGLQDLAGDEWILFARRVYPVVPAQICAANPGTKANGIVAVRLSCNRRSDADQITMSPTIKSGRHNQENRPQPVPFPCR